jgi:2-isopropylmalate synthase
MTLALNLYSQGVDPELTIAHIDAIVETVEYCNRLPVHPRHPYAGELVYTAFSGSHQDAIKKGFEALAKRNDELWEVPYLPIDPKDLGRSYEAVIRVNSQSGKGGIAFLLKTDHGLELPRALQVEFSRIVQDWTDRTGKEASSADIWTMFCQTYLGDGEIDLIEYRTFPDAHGRRINATIMDRGDERFIEGQGSDPLDGFVDALRRAGIADLAVSAYHEHALRAGSDAQAAAYVEAGLPDGGTIFGVGIDRDIASSRHRHCWTCPPFKVARAVRGTRPVERAARRLVATKGPHATSA